MSNNTTTQYFLCSIVTLVFTVFTSCEKEIPTNLTKAILIPKPVSVIATATSFDLSDKVSVHSEVSNEGINKVGKYLAMQISQNTGIPIHFVENTEKAPPSQIILSLSDNKELGEEGYELNIAQTQISLTANQPEGLFRGSQSLLQILPLITKEKQIKGATLKIATGIVKDYPSYSYRGSMLDVSRHFFGVEDVKRYIDFLAAFKMNVLHLHLSDDQGWRIEINKWPTLSAHGGSTQVGGGKGGFYTQKQYKEIVQYAADQYILVIPEIDMPGHTNAALASYPELNCNGKAPVLYTGTEVGFSTFCTDKEITYQFIDDVIAELAAITPGPYIHIGGDESHATKKADYLLFVNRVKGIVEAHGKKMIGWDETAQAGLNAGSTVQLWASPEFAREAVGKGAKIIMSPATKAYLDMQYDSNTQIGLHWAAYIEIDSSYIWDSATFIPGIPKESIIGIEAPLWTETITNMDEIEYMVFPRLLSYAEIGWTPVEQRNWEEYKTRLGFFGKRMEAMGIDFYRSKLVPWAE